MFVQGDEIEKVWLSYAQQDQADRAATAVRF